MDGDRSDASDGLDRRSVLRRLGSAGLAAGVAPVSLAAGEPTTDREDRTADLDVEWLDPPESRHVVHRLTATAEFARLARYVRGRGQAVALGNLDGQVARATRDGETVELAWFEVRGSDADEAYLTVARDTETGAVTTAGLEYADTVVVNRHAEASTATVSEPTVRTTVTGVDATDGMATETFDVDLDAASDRPQQYLRDQAGTLDHGVWCGLCQFAVGGLCEYGCGLPGWTLCGLLGLGSAAFGGLGCLAFVSAACAVIAVVGCGVTHATQKVCAHPSLDMCEPP